MENLRELHSQSICCHATIYQSGVRNGMKHSKVARTSGRNDGAFQISRGRIRVLANLDFHTANTASSKSGTITRTSS
jgi:hypothetical protein